jgi:hypothetical protein
MRPGTGRSHPTLKIALDPLFEGTEEIPNTVDRLKQIVRNFRDRRTGQVP